MDENELSNKIIEAATEVHRHLGPGLLEAVYEEALAHELKLRTIMFERQVVLPVVYKGVKLDYDYKLDFLVEKKIIIELKSADKHLLPIYEAQCINYLRLSGCKLCLLINFNETVLKNGIKRIVLLLPYTPLSICLPDRQAGQQA